MDKVEHKFTLTSEGVECYSWVNDIRELSTVVLLCPFGRWRLVNGV